MTAVLFAANAVAVTCQLILIRVWWIVLVFLRRHRSSLMGAAHG